MLALESFSGVVGKDHPTESHSTERPKFTATAAAAAAGGYTNVGIPVTVFADNDKLVKPSVTGE